ncbi:MAG: hypothetical protein QFX35_01115 [Candidatus Verstraetearchaeota archaeon]|nr:hypothetical protein [Candidatus Verstraetearchaeota archaeon]
MKEHPLKNYYVNFQKKELLKLAKKKNLREVPENWNKEKIVDALSLFVTKSDLFELTSNALKSKTSEGRGYELREIGDKLGKKGSLTTRK